MEDKRIIELYYSRDERALEQTSIKYGGLCYKIALNILSIREDAEECVNDTYHTAWRRMPPDMPNSLGAFLGRITRNLSISRFRSKRARKRYSGIEIMLSELDDCVPCAAHVECIADSRMLAEFISDWLDTLSDDDCALFVRRYWYGESVNGLASKCGCTPNQMAQRMLKLRKGLKLYLENKGIEV